MMFSLHDNMKHFLFNISLFCRPPTGRILEALHVDPASGVSIDKDKSGQMLKTPTSASSAQSKLNKTTISSSLSKQQGEKKETPQERLKRIMSKQLNKQSIHYFMRISGVNCLSSVHAAI